MFKPDIITPIRRILSTGERKKAVSLHFCGRNDSSQSKKSRGQIDVQSECFRPEPWFCVNAPRVEHEQRNTNARLVRQPFAGIPTLAQKIAIVSDENYYRVGSKA